MVIDLIVLLALALFGYRGFRTGTIKQLTHWIGMTLGRVIGKPLALILTLALAPDLGFPPVAVRVGISVLCFYTLYVVATIISSFLLRGFTPKRRNTKKERRDKLGGLVLGLGKGVVILLVLISVMLFFEKPLFRAWSEPPELMRHSFFVSLVRRNNVFGSAPLPEFARVEKLMQAARDPRSAQALSNDPKLKEMLDDPRIKASLQDEKFAKALKSGDWSALRKDPRIMALLQDPRLVGPLSDPFLEEEK
jgi:uncharacterized membrane protein required for colicin V production